MCNRIILKYERLLVGLKVKNLTTFELQESHEVQSITVLYCAVCFFLKRLLYRFWMTSCHLIFTSTYILYHVLHYNQVADRHIDHTCIIFILILILILCKQRRKIQKGHSKVENKITTPLPKKKIKKKLTYRFKSVHKTQHRKLETEKIELHHILVSLKGIQICCSCKKVLSKIKFCLFFHFNRSSLNRFCLEKWLQGHG